MNIANNTQQKEMTRSLQQIADDLRAVHAAILGVAKVAVMTDYGRAQGRESFPKSLSIMVHWLQVVRDQVDSNIEAEPPAKKKAVKKKAAKKK